MSPEATISDLFGPRHICNEARHQTMKVAAPIESTGEGSQVVFAVLAVLRRMERASQRRLQVV